MKGIKKLLTVTTVVAAVLCPRLSTAMPIRQFMQMPAQDRQDYLNFLEKSAEAVLNALGRTADARKVYLLFNEIHEGSKMSLGEGEFEMNLANVTVRDAERIAQDPNAQPMQVETALVGTLQANGIQLTPDFIKALVQAAATFKPKFSPAAKN